MKKSKAKAKATKKRTQSEASKQAWVTSRAKITAGIKKYWAERKRLEALGATSKPKTAKASK